MMRYLNRHRKALLIVLLLCVTAVAQVAALASEPETHHASDHCCLRCHVGPLPFLEASAKSAVAPVFEVVWLAPAPEAAVPHDVQLPASSARAPPVV
ncbi:MAG TPA: hypothetical protein VGF49_23525 [Candidatus Solibacter sp.]|jgi:hypothetical protein